MRKSRLVARKQGRYAEKASAGKEFASEIAPYFRRKRRAYRAPGRDPYNAIAQALGKGRLARPTQKMKCAS